MDISTPFPGRFLPSEFSVANLGSLPSDDPITPLVLFEEFLNKNIFRDSISAVKAIEPRNGTVADEFVTRFWSGNVFEPFQSDTTVKIRDPKTWVETSSNKKHGGIFIVLAVQINITSERS